MSSVRILALGGWATTDDCWKTVQAAWKKRPEAADTVWQSVSWSDLLDQPEDLFSQAPDATEKLLVVGWSLGGLLALQAVASRSERVAGMVLISSTARMTADGDYPGADPRAIRAMRLRVMKKPDRVLHDFAAAALAPETVESFPEIFLQWGHTFTSERLRDGLTYLAETDLRDTLEKIEVPVRIVHGTEDRIIPHTSADYLAGRLLHSELRSVCGAGHLLPVTAAETIAEEMALVRI